MSTLNPIQTLYADFKATGTRNRDGWNLVLTSLFGVALFSALLPFFYPIPFGAEWILFLLAAANLTFTLVVNARTGLIASAAMSRDLEPTRWTLIALTGLDARRIVVGKWGAILRKVWGWHVLAGLLRIGLALAAAQAIQSERQTVAENGCQGFRIVMSADLCHRYPVVPLKDAIYMPIQPIFAKFLAAGVVLVILSVGEAAMVTGLALATTVRNPSWLRGMIAPFLRVFVAVGFFALFAGIVPIENSARPDPSDPRWWSRNRIYGELVGITREIKWGISGLIDGGVSLSTMLLRPHDSRVYYIFEHAFALLSGLGLMSAIGFVGLRSAESGLIRRGALPRTPTLVDQLRDRLHLRRDGWVHPALFQAQHDHLRRTMSGSKWAKVGMLALYAFALAITLSPRWVFVNHTMGDWLIVIAAFALGASLIVGLRTAMAAADSIARERNTSAWDVLVLTTVDARRLVVSKWWAVVRWALPAHLLTIPLKFGLAYGFAQYFHATFVQPHYLFRAFNHISWNGRSDTISCISYEGSFPPPLCYPPHFPGFPTIIFAGLILLVVTLAEVGFFSALGTMCAALVKRGGARQLLLAVGLRAAMIATSIGGAIFLGSLLGYRRLSPPNFFDLPQSWLDAVNADYSHFNRIFESGQIMLSTFVDGGAMAAANVMRRPWYWIEDIFGILPWVRQFVTIFASAGVLIAISAIYLWVAVRSVRTNRE